MPLIARITTTITTATATARLKIDLDIDINMDTDHDMGSDIDVGMLKKSTEKMNDAQPWSIDQIKRNTGVFLNFNPNVEMLFFCTVCFVVANNVTTRQDKAIKTTTKKQEDRKITIGQAHIMTRRGKTTTRPDKPEQDNQIHDKTRQYRTRPDQNKTRHGKT
jgi:hypothetical protein